MFLLQSNAIRTVLRWQFGVTAAMTLAAAGLWGAHAGFSVLLGGLVSMVSGVVFALIARTSRRSSAGSVLRAALRAEAAKITVICLLLWLVFATYKELVALGFLGAFVVTVVIFSAAITVRDTE